MFSLALKPAQNAVPRETMGSIYIISSSQLVAATRRWQTRLGDLLQLPRCFFLPVDLCLSLRSRFAAPFRADSETILNERKVLREQINVIVPPLLFVFVSLTSFLAFPQRPFVLLLCFRRRSAFLLLFLSPTCACFVRFVCALSRRSAAGATPLVTGAFGIFCCCCCVFSFARSSHTLLLSVVVFRVPLLVTMSREDTTVMIGR